MVKLFNFHVGAEVSPELGGRIRDHELLHHRALPLLRGGLAFKAHIILYRSTLGFRVINKRRKSPCNANRFFRVHNLRRERMPSPRPWKMIRFHPTVWNPSCLSFPGHLWRDKDRELLHHRALPLHTANRSFENLRGNHEFGELRRRNVRRFRGGLVFEAHRPLNHSTPGSRVIKKKRGFGEIV